MLLCVKHLSNTELWQHTMVQVFSKELNENQDILYIKKTYIIVFFFKTVYMCMYTVKRKILLVHQQNVPSQKSSSNNVP
jgi:hypothetical protein